MKKQNEKTKFLNAIDTQIQELRKIMKENDSRKTLLIIATDDNPDDTTGLCSVLIGRHGDIVSTIEKTMKHDENFNSVISEACEIANNKYDIASVILEAQQIINSRKK